jgi:FMN phosphatase YigB (HAD superfamily)
MIKSIIFDLGNVIVPFDFKRGYARMEPLCGYPAAEIPKRIRGTDLVQRFETGQVGPEQFVEELSRVLDLRASYAEFCELWTSIFLPHTLVPEAWVAALRSRYKMVLLSNTNAIHFAMIEANYPLLRHFDEMVLSYRVGWMKPSPAIYREAVARAGCLAGECFFTDDVAAYVEGARREGIDAVQFLNAGQLKDDLEARGVRCG